MQKRAENEVLGDFIELSWLDEPDIAYSDREWRYWTTGSEQGAGKGQ